MPALKSVSRSTILEVQRVLPQQRAYTQGVKQQIEDKFEKAQKQFLNNFEKHPVTLEIGGGPNSTNISGTLNGVGNLFSYIGFDSGTKPLAALRVLLAKYEIRYHHTKRSTSINITLPTRQEIFKVTPIPWATGRSWAQGIETGISGLGQYLTSNSPRSRSGSAIQTKGKIRSGRFTNVPYLSSLLKEYYKEIRKVEKTSI